MCHPLSKAQVIIAHAAYNHDYNATWSRQPYVLPSQELVSGWWGPFKGTDLKAPEIPFLSNKDRQLLSSLTTGQSVHTACNVYSAADEKHCKWQPCSSIPTHGTKGQKFKDWDHLDQSFKMRTSRLIHIKPNFLVLALTSCACSRKDTEVNQLSACFIQHSVTVWKSEHGLLHRLLQ